MGDLLHGPWSPLPFKLFVFSQPLVSRDIGLAKLDKRFDGAATPSGQEINA